MVRVIGPALIVYSLVVGFGFAVTGPLAVPLNGEDAVNRSLAARRVGTWDAITTVWSFLGTTSAIVAVCLVVSAVLLWRTHDWRLAAVPAMAILVQLLLYLTATAFVHRERPSVQRMESLLPMSSYPSGHVGASTALYLAIILLASRVSPVGWRRAITALCAAVPLLVAFSRLYQGMHHVSDVVVGMAGGAACAILAYRWYVHRAQTSTVSTGTRQRGALRKLD